MPRKLTAEQIAGYERDGYICPVDAFSPERARGWRERLEDFERAEGRKMTRGHNFKPHLLFPWVDEIVHAPEVLDAVEDLIGPDIRLFHLTAWPKDAGSGTYVSWHQDATYFALEPACHVTAWVALTDAPVEVGLHGSGARLAQAGPAAACRDAGHREPAVARPDPGERRRSHEDGLHAGEGGPVLAASHASGAQFAAQPLARPAHRARHQLHPDLGALHLGDARHRHAGARRGHATDISTTSGGRLAEAGPEERAFHAEAVARFRAMNAVESAGKQGRRGETLGSTDRAPPGQLMIMMRPGGPRSAEL